MLTSKLFVVNSGLEYALIPSVSNELVSGVGPELVIVVDTCSDLFGVVGLSPEFVATGCDMVVNISLDITEFSEPNAVLVWEEDSGMKLESDAIEVNGLVPDSLLEYDSVL